MAVTRMKIQSSLLFVSHFLSFSGYYVCLMILSNLGLIAFSRGLTVPLRILILGCLCGIILANKKLYIRPATRLFVVFSSIYIARIIVEMARMKVYHLDASEYLLYFLAFGALPLLIISGLKLTERDYYVIKWSLLISGFLLSLFTVIYYHSLIGTVGRISLALSKDENYISPLALSYCGTLTIGLSLNYLLENKTSIKEKLMMLTLIMVSLVPFYLGASRGSVFALFLPFVFLGFFKNSLSHNIRLFAAIAISAAAGIYLSELFGSSVVNRIASIGSDVEQSSSSALRLELWKAGFGQFLDNPVFGNSLEVDAYQFHPHNIIIEVLLTTGIIGFIPFAILMVNGFRKAVFVYRNDPRNGWISILFIQSFIQNMFSGSIYGASWLWVSLGLLYSFEYAVRPHKSSITWYN